MDLSSWIFPSILNLLSLSLFWHCNVIEGEKDPWLSPAQGWARMHIFHGHIPAFWILMTEFWFISQLLKAPLSLPRQQLHSASRIRRHLWDIPSFAQHYFLTSKQVDTMLCTSYFKNTIHFVTKLFLSVFVNQCILFS